LNDASGPLTLDLSGVTFMDSSGLRVILDRLKDGPITLVSPSPQVQHLLELCRLTDLKGLTLENPPGGAA
jgi:anti-anti-sigma factor